MTLPDELVTERLRLPLWTAADVAAIRGGARSPAWHPDFPREDDVDASSLWRDGDPWSSRSITVDGVAVGSIGFFGPPQPAADGAPEVEIGYGLVEAARGAGYATETPVQSFYRQVRLWRIGHGTSEIHRWMIARDMLGKAAR